MTLPTASDQLSPRDLAQLAEAGIRPDEVERQLEILRRPPPPVRLQRPCRPGDGIVRLPPALHRELAADWRKLLRQRRVAKFVPASGAATRMFKDLLSLVANTETAAGTEGLRANQDERAIAAADRLVRELPRFAFHDQLAGCLSRRGLDLEEVVARRDYVRLIRFLLDPEGLGFRDFPKGLLPFHRYPDGPRTALEDHLWEGAGYLAEPGGVGRHHFTVPKDSLADFRRLAQRRSQDLERELEVSLEVDFSVQSPATDTVAVDLEGRLFRDSDGRLLLRPSGHGSLLGNLQALAADVVFIKNIDNIAHQRLHAESVQWKRLLAGWFYRLQAEIFRLQEELASRPDDPVVVERGLRFIRTHLAVEPPPQLGESDTASCRRFVTQRLDRPLRVCGMVRNEGDPGGGPFWLSEADGGCTGQIVEAAQANLTSGEQAAIWKSSTHFNPVDLVCGWQNYRGEPYDLERFVDPRTWFVARKDHLGQPLEALERPGLWNGAMAGWNTAFVEVPVDTFTPVKTILDLVRAEHQPG